MYHITRSGVHLGYSVESKNSCHVCIKTIQWFQKRRNANQFTDDIYPQMTTDANVLITNITPLVMCANSVNNNIHSCQFIRFRHVVSVSMNVYNGVLQAREMGFLSWTATSI